MKAIIIPKPEAAAYYPRRGLHDEKKTKNDEQVLQAKYNDDDDDDEKPTFLFCRHLKNCVVFVFSNENEFTTDLHINGEL